jgi:hypothetical protein
MRRGKRISSRVQIDLEGRRRNRGQCVSVAGNSNLPPPGRQVLISQCKSVCARLAGAVRKRRAGSQPGAENACKVVCPRSTTTQREIDWRLLSDALISGAERTGRLSALCSLPPEHSSNNDVIFLWFRNALCFKVTLFNIWMRVSCYEIGLFLGQLPKGVWLQITPTPRQVFQKKDLRTPFIHMLYDLGK